MDAAKGLDDKKMTALLLNLEKCFFENELVMDLVEKSQEDRNPWQLKAQMKKLREEVVMMSPERVLLVVPTPRAGDLFRAICNFPSNVQGSCNCVFDSRLFV